MECVSIAAPLCATNTGTTTHDTAALRINLAPASIIETAKAWLAIGGRIMIEPHGRLYSTISMDRIFSCDLTDAEAEARMAVSRAYNVAEEADPAGIATLVREYGELHNGFVVWRGDR